MAFGGEVSFKFEQESIASIIRKRGLESNGRVQKFVDSEVMRNMEKYMPKLSGTMINSMILATRVGSGEVKVNTPYARKVSKKARSNGLRGARFFERMKADCADDILRGAAIISGGEAKK